MLLFVCLASKIVLVNRFLQRFLFICLFLMGQIARQRAFSHVWQRQLFDAKLHSSRPGRLVGCEMINSLFVFLLLFLQ